MSGALATQSPTAEMRLLPAPPCAPPFDDELPRGTLRLTGQLTLLGAPPAAQCVGELRPGPSAEETEDLAAAQRTPRAALPDPQQWASRFAQALAEVLSANRSARQLLRWTSWPLYQEVEASIGRLAASSRPVLRSIHVSEPAEGVAEACAIVRVGARCRALALRFEGLDGGWRCTAARLC